MLMTQIKSMNRLSNTVQYHPYDPNLPAVFDKVKSLIQQALPAVQVEHVGSSSIPGVGGRNVIDMVIPAENQDQPSVKQHLLALGFQNSPFQHFLPLLVGVVSDHGQEYTILLYVIPPDSDIYRGWITFRDYMRTHSEDAQAYDTVKQQTIASGNVEVRRYQQAKTPFLVSMTEKIRNKTRS
jgi:GrpB-like predicted nucleotidyltransferase (UPF0157 family)